MFSKVRKTLLMHVKNNSNKYIFLFLAFVIGISAGAFTVNGLSTTQGDELSNYFQGFLKLLGNQNLDSEEILNAALLENIKIIGALWVLGMTIIGIPFIYLLIGIRGFITGFTAGFIIQSLGFKGVLFTLLAILPKELIIVPCLLALSVNGINFSLNIIKSKSIKSMFKESLKSNFAAYSMVTLFFTAVIFVGILVEVYIIPLFVRLIAPAVTG